MSQRLIQAVDRLRAGDQPVRTFECISTGLNGSLIANPLNAILCITNSAVIVAWEKPAITWRKALAERFEREQILGVEEGAVAMSGLAGALARKSAEHPLGPAIGQTGKSPALTLKTRRGDVVLFFKAKAKGDLREAYVVRHCFGLSLVGAHRVTVGQNRWSITTTSCFVISVVMAG